MERRILPSNLIWHRAELKSLDRMSRENQSGVYDRIGKDELEPYMTISRKNTADTNSQIDLLLQNI